MEHPKEGSNSLYDYSDKSISQAGYAAIVYAIVSAFSTAVAWFQAPNMSGVAVAIVALVLGGGFGALAFGIFRKSRVAVVVMLVLVIGFQLYTWIVARSFAGTILSVIVAGFLLRGARRIFQDHAERAATET